MAQAGDPSTPGSAAAAVSPQIQRYGPALARVAWLSIGLGLAMELALLLFAVALGTAESATSFLAELAQKVSWSTIVCVGLAVGKLASKAQLGLAGFLGLISAPLGFAVARTIHKGAAQALQVTIGSAPGALVFAVALNKGVEYGGLGLAIAYAEERWRIGARGHVAVGLLFGVVFGGVTLALTSPGLQALSLSLLLAWAVNELLFPVGCSLVLYATDLFGPQQADAEGSPEGAS